LPLAKKRVLLSISSFLYSLLFRFAVDSDIAFNILLLFSEGGLVSSRDMDYLSGFFYVVLTLGLVFLIIFYFER